MRTMRARYAGFCTTCKRRISVGDRIVYEGKGKTFHVSCYRETPGEDKPGEPTVKQPPKRPTLPAQVGEKVFTVDWVDLKSDLLAAFEGNFKAFPQHRSDVEAHLVSPNVTWQGYEGEDTKRWLVSGYKTDAIKGLGDFNPPLRDRRRILYVEEGDEFHYDLAASGDERFMSEWTKIPAIPGCSVQIALGFSSGVSERVLNQYAAWCCKAIYSLDVAGIDTEIMIHYKADNMVVGESGPHDTRVRVKSEGENLDFLGFSAMLSPAQFRAYMFCAMYLHCESRGRKITPGHGHSISYFKDWAVRWEPEAKKLYIDCDYSGRNFSEERMEAQLRKALGEMTQ
jgi:hypothetical protein